MRLLLDEDCGSRSLTKALRDHGHDVERVVDLAELGGAASDETVFAYAVASERVLVTKNGADFAEIARRDPERRHCGICVLHYGARGSSLPIASVVRALENIASAYGDSTEDLILSLNQHVW